MDVTYTSRDGSFTATRTFATLPPATQQAMLSRAFAHILGNEAASRVTSWKEKNEGADDAAIAAKLAEVRAELLGKIDAGTLGTRVSGPKVDPVERVMDRIALGEVVGIVNAQGIDLGKKPDEDTPVTFGDGTTRTLGELVERRLDKHGERIRGEAEAEIKAKAREKAKAEKAKAEKAATLAGNGLNDLL